jgi:hypothetical protein
MKRSRSFLGLLIVAFGALSAGCAGEAVQFHNAVPQGIDRSAARQVEASATGFQLFHFIPIRTNSRHARAYERLLKEAGNAYVTDVKMKEAWKYALVGTIYTTTFQATAYPKWGSTSSAAPGPGPAGIESPPDEARGIPRE